MEGRSCFQPFCENKLFLRFMMRRFCKIICRFGIVLEKKQEHQAYTALAQNVIINWNTVYTFPPLYFLIFLFSVSLSLFSRAIYRYSDEGLLQVLFWLCLIWYGKNRNSNFFLHVAMTMKVQNYVRRKRCGMKLNTFFWVGVGLDLRTPGFALAVTLCFFVPIHNQFSPGLHYPQRRFVRNLFPFNTTSGRPNSRAPLFSL